MKLLLDTHVLIWSQEAPEKLGASAQALLLDPQNDNLVSPISCLEIAQLLFRDRIQLKLEPHEWFKKAIDKLHAKVCEFSPEIALAAYQLPGEFHADPADRILVSTSRYVDAQLITADRKLLGYPAVMTVNALK